MFFTIFEKNKFTSQHFQNFKKINKMKEKLIVILYKNMKGETRKIFSSNKYKVKYIQKVFKEN